MAAKATAGAQAPADQLLPESRSVLDEVWKSLGSEC